MSLSCYRPSIVSYPHRGLGVRDLVRPLSLDRVGVEILRRPGACHGERAVVGPLSMSHERPK